MSEENKSKSFTEIYPAPVSEEEAAVAELEGENEGMEVSENKVLKGLGEQMSETVLHNVGKLAPLDVFEIGGVTYNRQKITPKKLRELRTATQEYLKDIKNLDRNDPARLERDFQLTYLKANIYFGMTQEQFDETDIEYLNQVLQATELRTQGFRKR